MEIFQRTEMLLGAAAMERLAAAHVAVFGLGGVGSYVAEALARSGVGGLTLVDNDTIAPSNINRQLIALHSTVGRKKTEVARQRALDVNPALDVRAVDLFFTPENAGVIDFSVFSYVVDAIDTVTAKLEIVLQARDAGVPVISCMGTGNKLEPARLEVADITETSMCPLAKVMRRELKKRGIYDLKVVYSKEEPTRPGGAPAAGDGHKKNPPGSVAFVPAAAGLMLAGEVVRDMIR